MSHLPPLDAGNYCWLDLETDGLNPNRPGAGILEIAVIVTNGEFKPLDVFQTLVCPNSDPKTWDPYVQNMHGKSGLLGELLGSTEAPPTAEEVDKTLCEFLRTHGCFDVLTPLGGRWRSPLCGYTPQGVDRPYMKVFLPETEKRLSYRNLDVSSWVYPMEALGLPKHSENAGPKHRAMEDIAHSLETFKAVFNDIQGATFRLGGMHEGRVPR